MQVVPIVAVGAVAIVGTVSRPESSETMCATIVEMSRAVSAMTVDTDVVAAKVRGANSAYAAHMNTAANSSHMRATDAADVGTATKSSEMRAAPEASHMTTASKASHMATAPKPAAMATTSAAPRIGCGREQG